MKISVIIPVYRAEKTIGKCLDSLLANDFSDYEIILIEDGVVDGVGIILQEYQSKYPDKIKFFNQANQGVAKTRNRGMETAKGEYLMFVDCDDFVGKDYLETFLAEAEKRRADAIFGGYFRTDDQKILYTQKLSSAEWARYIVMAPWAKIYRRDFLLKNKIEFLDNNIGEDVYFNLQVINFSEKIFTFDYAGYFWFDNKKSVSNSLQKNLANRLEVLFLLDSCAAKLGKRGVLNKKENEFYFVRYVVWYLLFAGRNSAKEVLVEESEKLLAWLKGNFPNFLSNAYISLFLPKGESPANRLAVWFFWKILYRLNLMKIFLRFYARG